MPYAIRKQGDEYVLVIKKPSGETEVVGHHDSKAAAQRQQRAIEANKRK